MRFAAIAPAGRRLASPSTGDRLLIRTLRSAPPWVPDQPSSTAPSASGRPPTPSHRSHLDSSIAPALRRTAFRVFDRRLGSQASPSAASEQPPSSASLDPTVPSSSQLSPRSFDDTVQKNMKVFTFGPSSHFAKHKPLKRIKLYGDTEETVIVQESFQVSLGSALILPLGLVLLKNMKCMLAFEYPMDLTMWRINSFCEFEIAAGTKMRHGSEFHLNTTTPAEIDPLGANLNWSEYCLMEFGGEVPAKFTNLLEKMKSCTENKGYSLLVDPSLIPSLHWTSVFQDVFHIVMHVMTKSERERFLKKLAPYCQAWHKDMMKNPLLRCFVMYSQSDGTFAKRDKNCPLAFLECICHALSHPLDYLELMNILGLKSYTKQDLHLLLQEKGGDKLVSDICNLLRIKYWQVLALERYLCREGSSCCPIPTVCIRRRFRDEPCHLDTPTVSKLKMVCEKRSKYENLFRESAVLNDWKLLHAESRVSAVKGFWSMFASLRDYSIWLCNREDDLGDCNRHEALNIVCGLLQKMSACRKYSFGKMLVNGSPNTPFKMKGFWVFPGVEVPGFLIDLNGMESYKWIRVNVSDEKDRELVDSILNENPLDEEPVVAPKYMI
ncbi:unnamed protein product [Alopecurus aequalis]